MVVFFFGVTFLVLAVVAFLRGFVTVFGAGFGGGDSNADAGGPFTVTGGWIVISFFAAGAGSVRVGDHPCQEPRQTYATSGIAAAVAAAGGETVTLDPARCRRVALGGARLKEWEVFPEILEADLVINVPVLKHHGLSRTTACMKNYMGVMEARKTFHQAIPDCLTDLTRFMKPRICILDAVRVLTAHGPKGGNPADVGKAIGETFGTKVLPIEFKEINDLWEKADRQEARKQAQKWMDEAAKVVEPTAVTTEPKCSGPVGDGANRPR